MRESFPLLFELVGSGSTTARTDAGLGELADQFAQREPSVRLQRFRGTCGGGLVGASLTKPTTS